MISNKILILLGTLAAIAIQISESSIVKITDSDSGRLNLYHDFNNFIRNIHGSLEELEKKLEDLQLISVLKSSGVINKDFNMSLKELIAKVDLNKDYVISFDEFIAGLKILGVKV